MSAQCRSALTDAVKATSVRGSLVLLLTFTILPTSFTHATQRAWFEVIATDSITGDTVNYRGRVAGSAYHSAISPRLDYVKGEGQYELEVTNPLYVTARCSSWIAADCTTRIPVRLVPITHTKVRIAAIRDRVTDMITSEPVVGARVLLEGVNTDQSGLAWSHTDTAGIYAIQVPPGWNHVVCRPRGYDERLARVLAPPNKVTKLDLTVSGDHPRSDSCLRLLQGVRILHLAGYNQGPIDSLMIRHNDSLRILVWNAYRNGSERLALRRLSFTVEGDAITEYLLVNHGRPTLIVNTLADLHGSEQVTAQCPAGLRLVYRSYDASTQAWHESDYPQKHSQDADLVLTVTLRPGDKYPYIF